MAMRVWICVLTSACAALALCAGVPQAAFAGNGPAKPGAMPKPDEQKKVWTNDDVERLNPEYVSGAAKQPSIELTVPPTTVVTPVGPRVATVPVAVAAPRALEDDPAWYGRQLDALQDQLAAVESQEGQLAAFRSSNSTQGMPTGLMLNAPCSGITTDNLIANLDSQRQQILAQIDALDDLARGHGFAPGALVAAAAAPPTSEEQSAAVAETLQNANEQLAEVQSTVGSMQDQTATLGATLQQPTPGFGGNMTTDLLDRLGARASALENEIDSATDEARSLGMAPGSTR
jgi:methyl-accepting chemotaxis protein